MEKRQAYYLINQPHFGENWHDGISSSWDYDYRGAKKMTIDRGPYSISNIDGRFPTAFIREMQVAKEGVFTLENSVVFSDGFDGFIMSLYDEDENDMMRIITRDGAFMALGGCNEYVTLLKPENTLGKHWFNIILDFDVQTITYYIDSLWCATLPMLGKTFKYLKIGTIGTHKVGVDMSGPVDLYANFALHDSFKHYPEGSVPFMWKAQGDVKVNREDELVLKSDKKEASAYKKFDAQKGKLLLETYHFNYVNNGGTVLDVMHGKNVLFTVSTKDGDLYLNGKKVRYFLDEMWYRFRFELDTKEGQGKFFVNNKEPYEFTFEQKSLDGIRYTSKGGAELRIDNLALQHMIEYDDYCPKPVPPKGYGDYTIGMNMCSLWRTGNHVGWDCITAFPEIKPVLGYYDEGIPEVADWEIKFMVENGINQQYYCWYLGQYRNGPIKKSRLSDALVDGFMNAKYSDMMQFGLIFEAAATPESPEAFKRYIVPFWIENFFTDKRYARIGNKAVICIYSLTGISDKFGSDEAVKDCFDYLREEVKKVGYEDLVIFTNVPINERTKAMGVDACYVYNWGRQGYSCDYQILQQKAKEEKKHILPFIPTASTGFNRLPWDTERSPVIEPSEFQRLLQFYKDDSLPALSDCPEWMHKFIMLSNWNEYGEGTYLCPNAQYGFGHIEAVKNVFTGGHDDGINHNIKPTANQLKRLSTLYPQDRRTIRCADTEERSKNLTSINENNLVLDMNPNLGNWETDQLDIVETDGTLKGTSNNSDAKFLYIGKLDIPCDKANVLKFTLDSSCFGDVVIYYTTTDSPNWCSMNRAVITVQAGKHEYCVPLAPGTTRRIQPYNSPSKTYTGNVTGIRIDPSSAPGVTSELINCRLYHECSGGHEGHLFINGEDMILDNDFVEDSGHFMVPIFPERCILMRLNAYYKYNASRKLLSIFANNKSVEFEIGSRKAMINGETVSLDVIPYFYNGLPMVPFDLLCDVFGYRLEYKDRNIYVTTPFDK